MSENVIKEQSEDGIDRRGFLKCMAWVGTGLIWSMSGGILAACDTIQSLAAPASDFSFVQISDSHIGFKNDPNHDVTATFQLAIDKINKMQTPPAFLIHTGDLTHLSKPDQFDTVSQVVKNTKSEKVFYVPGEHDVIGDNGKFYLDHFGKGVSGKGWQSFDYKGVHFIGLINVLDLKAGGLGKLGPEQLDWLTKDVQGLSNSTPIVVYAHVPLWMVYPDWGWGTEDSEQALTTLKRFGSLTVLNGHIHQILQKVEGSVTFHTARSTAFPQPAPGTAQSPGPIKNVPADKLRTMLGITDVNFVSRNTSLAVLDTTLA